MIVWAPRKGSRMLTNLNRNFDYAEPKRETSRTTPVTPARGWFRSSTFLDARIIISALILGVVDRRLRGWARSPGTSCKPALCLGYLYLCGRFRIFLSAHDLREAEAHDFGSPHGDCGRSESPYPQCLDGHCLFHVGKARSVTANSPERRDRSHRLGAQHRPPGWRGKPQVAGAGAAMAPRRVAWG